MSNINTLLNMQWPATPSTFIGRVCELLPNDSPPSPFLQLINQSFFLFPSVFIFYACQIDSYSSIFFYFFILSSFPFLSYHGLCFRIFCMPYFFVSLLSIYSSFSYSCACFSLCSAWCLLFSFYFILHFFNLYFVSVFDPLFLSTSVPPSISILLSFFYLYKFLCCTLVYLIVYFIYYTLFSICCFLLCVFSLSFLCSTCSPFIFYVSVSLFYVCGTLISALF